MFRLAVSVGICAVSAAVLAQDQWWCNGDGFGETGLSCERDTLVSDGRVYDDFDVPVRATVRGAWGNFLISGFTPAQAYYEIRSKVRVGNGGVLHASGIMAVEVHATGRITKGLTEYLVRGAFPQPLVLDPERYWVTVAPMGYGAGRCFVSTARGTDESPDTDPTPPPLGTPHDNDNSFFDSLQFGKRFADTEDELGDGSWDFSFGVGPHTGPPQRAAVEVFEVTFGKYLQGDVGDLERRYDGRRIAIQQSTYARISAPNVQLLVEGRVGSSDALGYLVLTAASTTSASPEDAVIHRIELFDFEKQVWETVYEGPAGLAYNGVSGSVTSDTQRFIEPETRKLRAALSWFDRGSTSLNWTAYIDQVYWVMEPR